MRCKLWGHNYIYSLKIIILLDKFGNLPRKHYKEASFAKVVYRGINTAFGRALTAIHNNDVFQPIKVIGNNGKSWILDNKKILIKAIYITASGLLQIMLNSWLHWYMFWIITPQMYNKIMIFFLRQEYHSNNYGIPPFTWHAEGPTFAPTLNPKTMNNLKLKTKKVEEQVVKTYKKIENGVVSGYQATEDSAVGIYKKIEHSAVSGYQAIEDSAVGLYQTIENKFVDTFLDGNNTKKHK